MEEADAGAVVAWRNRPEAARWLIQWEPLTEERHLGWFQHARDREVLVVFEDTRTGQPIGTCSFWDFDRTGQTAEWGRLVSAGNSGNPLGLLEGGYLAHRLIFELFGLARTYCGAAEENAPSRRFAEFLGYTQEGLRRKHLVTPHGAYSVAEYGLFTAEFDERRPQIERSFYRRKDAPAFSGDAQRAAQEFRTRRFGPQL